MKSVASVAIVLAALIHGAAHAAEAASAPSGEASESSPSGTEIEISPSTDAAESEALANQLSDFCFFAGKPPADQKYSVVKNLKVGKGTYGGVKDILPKLADRARKTGADAIINYTGSQRFGFFPWRMVRPVVRGVGIKWADPKKPACAELGGTTLKAIIESDKPPAQ
jgi:hypothetical protein